ncbi:formylglycine-generating enzyme family protein [Parafrankia sp. FMc2]|uniref:formylglycine-generating enzyme family protein n=1 Tax=Parafrankia sp. FMc2 TaxID=3233196 RepID=UPI0034D50774
MNTYEPTRPVFRECLREICRTINLDNSQHLDLLTEIASRLPDFMCTPFYFKILAEFVETHPDPSDVLSRSPLELLRISINQRFGDEAYDDLIACATGRIGERGVEQVAGILNEHGAFVHDGYRNVVLAGALLDHQLAIRELIALPNAIPAVRIALDHIEKVRSPRSETAAALIDELEQFVVTEQGYGQIRYLLYFQGLIARSLRRVRRETAALALRTRCLDLISNDEARRLRDSGTVAATLLWDISDALSLINDPRLYRARHEKYAPTSGYFTFVPRQAVEIGSEFTPQRIDDAKPVLPYTRQEVQIGPMWIANFLVTNEQYQEFWNDPDRSNYFVGTGRQWIDNDATVIAAIEDSFDVAARRCFWKEARDEASAVVAGVGSSMPILDIARVRALRQAARVALWDPTQADDRFSAPGSPVVGITWWEAIAFCQWWTDRKLPDSGFPEGSVANLATDWEWEALRRVYYDGIDVADASVNQSDRYGAHLRKPNRAAAAADGRISNILRPLHVGLFTVPAGPGPFDMVGNVWEWTRSKVYGNIVPTTIEHGSYGHTAWEDIDASAEQIAESVGGEIVDQNNDLNYRAVRGASFFSIDPQAAW